MKKTFLLTVILGFLTLAIYQNCSPSHSDGGTPFSIATIYPYYDAKPAYFDSVQLTKVAQENKKWVYEFVVGAVYLDDPEKMIDVEVRIDDQDDKILCTTTSVRVNSSSNHIMIDDCGSDDKVSLIQIRIFLKLATETNFPTKPHRVYAFPIQ